MEWRVEHISVDRATIEIFTNPDGLSLNGVPQVKDSLHLMLPDDATLSGNRVTLIYPAPLDPLTEFVWPSSDPAVRSRTGSFVAGWTQPFFGAFTSLGWEVTLVDPLTCRVDAPTAEFGLLVETVERWQSYPGGQVAATMLVTGTSITFGFTAPIDGEIGLNHTGSADDTIDLAGARLNVSIQAFEP